MGRATNKNNNNNKNNVNNSKQVVNVIIDHYKRKPRKKKVNNNQQILKPNVLPINIVNNIPGMAPSFQDLHRYHTNVANDDLINDLKGQVEDMNDSINHLSADGQTQLAEVMRRQAEQHQQMIRYLETQRNIEERVNLPPDQNDLGFPQGSDFKSSIYSDPPLHESTKPEDVISLGDKSSSIYENQYNQKPSSETYENSYTNPEFEPRNLDETEEFTNALNDRAIVTKVDNRVIKIGTPGALKNDDGAGPSNSPIPLTPIQYRGNAEDNFVHTPDVDDEKLDADDEEYLKTPDISQPGNLIRDILIKRPNKRLILDKYKQKLENEFSREKYNSLTDAARQQEFKDNLKEFSIKYFNKIADVLEQSIRDASIYQINKVFERKKGGNRIDLQLKYIQQHLFPK